MSFKYLLLALISGVCLPASTILALHHSLFFIPLMFIGSAILGVMAGKLDKKI